MSEKNEQFLVVLTYKSVKSVNLFNLKATWQVVDTKDNCEILIDNLATAEEARIKRDAIKELRNAA